MWWLKTPVQAQTGRTALQDLAAQDLAAQDLTVQALALEDNAARAGFALGCSYSTSQEYEAALIAARRAAGLYGPKGRRWPLRIMAGIAAGVAVVVIIILII